MKLLETLWLTFADFFLRYVPLPVHPGLRALGTPNKQSPVLVTCNNFVTVSRVVNALATRNAYLMILNSGGMDFGSALEAGTVSPENVGAALMSSRLQDKVAVRQVIVPGFCQATWEGAQFEESWGWKLVYGPRDSPDLASFIDKGTLTPQMQTPRFDAAERIAVALSTWLLTISLFVLPLLLFGWQVMTIALTVAGLGFLSLAFLYPMGEGKYKLLKAAFMGTLLGLTGAVYTHQTYGTDWMIGLWWLGTCVVIGLWCGYAYADPFRSSQRQNVRLPDNLQAVPQTNGKKEG